VPGKACDVRQTTGQAGRVGLVTRSCGPPALYGAASAPCPVGVREDRPGLTAERMRSGQPDPEGLEGCRQTGELTPSGWFAAA